MQINFGSIKAKQEDEVYTTHTFHTFTHYYQNLKSQVERESQREAEGREEKENNTGTGEVFIELKGFGTHSSYSFHTSMALYS